MSAADRIARLNAKALRRFGALHKLNGRDVQGDFVRPGKNFTVGDAMGIAARVPSLVIVDADVPAGPVGLSAECDGETYTVAEALPDGFGFTVLELESA